MQQIGIKFRLKGEKRPVFGSLKKKNLATVSIFGRVLACNHSHPFQSYPFSLHKMSPPMSGKGKDSATARILGSGTSGMQKRRSNWRKPKLTRRALGIAELLIFHPVDTVAKRLMSNKAKVRQRLALSLLHFHSHFFFGSQKVSLSTLSPIIFRDSATAPIATKFLSLFPGLGYAAGYKVAQRVYKFGGQPWFNDILTRNYKTSFTNTFGERKGKLMMQATAGRSVPLKKRKKPSCSISLYL